MVARCRAHPAAAAGRGVPDRRPQVSAREKATGPDRAACRRVPGARPARGRGQQSQGSGLLGTGTSSSGSGSGPARCSLGSPTWPAGCCRPRGSGLPGAEHVQQRQRAGVGQVLARLADVASRPRGRAARCRARPAAAAGQRWPGARPAHWRGRQAAGVGAARRRARPAAAAGRGRPGARPARGRGWLGAAGRGGRSRPALGTSSRGSGQHRPTFEE